METMNIFSLAKGAGSCEVRIGVGMEVVVRRKSRNRRKVRISRMMRRERRRERSRRIIVVLKGAQE